MIATIDEVKKLINIAESVNTYDAFIEAILPTVEEQLFDRINTHFENFDVQVSAGSTVFSKSDNKITVPGYTDLTIEFFHDDAYIFVDNSYMNDGFLKIKSLSGNEITLNDIDILINETSKNTVYITKCDLPKGILLLLAKMVAHNMVVSGVRDPAVESEQVGDYKVVYTKNKDGTVASYPDEIEKMFKQYQRPKFIKSFS